VVDPDELTGERLETLKKLLLVLRTELQATVADSAESVKPVDLDEPIGRLSRMDAMQQQQMASANRDSAKVRLAQVNTALRHVDDGEYGACVECEEPIGFRRLSAQPESQLCLACKSTREAR
jgi:DnaK suppressor protein